MIQMKKFLGYTREQRDAEMAERARERLQSVQDDDSCQSSGRLDRFRDAGFFWSLRSSSSWLVQSFDSICGPVNILDDFSEGDYFRWFFTDEVFNLFVAETNR